MYKKQLYKTALISSPIMAAFALSPVFFMVKDSPWKFLLGTVMMSLVVFTIWLINIYLIARFESRKSFDNKYRYILSFLLLIIFVVCFLYASHFIFPPDPRKPNSMVFPLINAITLNTIVLIISNTVVIRSKKIAADVELTSLKIKHLEAEQQQLIQQLQPHFLFNSLSTLKSLIKNDAELAEEYLIKLSGFLRFTISAQENKVIPLAAELQFTQDYIELQQIRFSGSFYSEIDIPEEKKLEYYIPVFALQTLVENAIKHNAFTEENPLKVSIAFHDESLVVVNNKIPKLNVGKGGVGLKNLIKRYSLVGGKSIVIDDTDQTFSVTIKLLKNSLC